MTFAVGHVEGGTNAGRKVQKTRDPWAHDCYPPLQQPLKHGEMVAVRVLMREGRTLPGATYSCPDCGTRRP